VTTTTLPSDVLGTHETKTLPRTGFPFAFYTAVGLFVLLLGGGALYAGRVEKN
jgi:LPXTG-motif cell wall-anchored protein